MSDKKRTITLTNGRPVIIAEANWPVVAKGTADDDDSNNPGNPPNREWKRHIIVRQHEDGRAIVYGVYDYDTCFQGERGAMARRGVKVDVGGDIIAAIREVGNDLREAENDADIAGHKAPASWTAAIQSAIADLPGEELT